MTEATAELYRGDCMESLAKLEDNSIDAVITDPPYGLTPLPARKTLPVIRGWLDGDRAAMPKGRGFLSAPWDAFVPPPALWDEVSRVLKPGGHLVSFSGARTQDLTALAIRLAGFEIRDSLIWIRGGSMPKSSNVSQLIDRSRNQNRDRQLEFTEWMRSTGITAGEINEATGTHMGTHYLTAASQPAIATADLFDKLRPHLPEVPESIERLVAERTGIEWTDYAKRRVIGHHTKSSDVMDWRANHLGRTTEFGKITESHSEEAKAWEGWGTGVKPNHEPAILARKPMDGTLATNVLEHGTGALNIEASRHGERWPNNVAVDEDATEQLGDRAHYFYCPRAGRSERVKVDGVSHPTVKPLELMRWIVRLVTPPGGVVLDPFAGSGSTLEAARLEGFSSIGMERDPAFVKIIEHRLGLES